MPLASVVTLRAMPFAEKEEEEAEVEELR